MITKAIFKIVNDGGPGGGGGGVGRQPSFFGRTKYHPIEYDILGQPVREAPRRKPTGKTSKKRNKR